MDSPPLREPSESTTDSRSLDMAPLDRSHTSSYTSSVSLSSTVTEIFSVEYLCDLDIWVRGR